jgi:DNA-directed RNA polymerase subunit RPC12/RpoP
LIQFPAGGLSEGAVGFCGRRGNEMEINCLGCGFKVDLTDAYDDFVGQIKCFACGATMEIATQAGEIRAVSPVTDEPSPSAEVFVVRSPD